MDQPSMSKRWWKVAERDPIHEVAAEWFASLQDPELNVEVTSAWQQWMAADPRHAEAFHRIEEVWIAAEAIEDRGDGNRATYDTDIPIGQWLAIRATRRRNFIWGTVTASAACVLAGFGLWWSSSRGDLIETPVGRNRAVTLEDGSQVELGGNTAIRVKLDNASRRVVLLQGEAFFKVAKDTARPFEVGAGDAMVTAVGTAFNVRRGSERVVVAVLEGRVKITSPETPASVPVDAGQQTVVVKSALKAPVRLPSDSSVTAWVSGRLSFDQEPLRYALEVVNRYSAKPIVVEDAAVAAVAITGTARSDNVSGWLKSLDSSFGLQAVEETDRIVLRKHRNGSGS